MCKLGAQTNEILMVSEYEANNPEWMETIKVIRFMKEQVRTFLKNNKIEVFLCCGADLLESFAKPGVWAEKDVCIVSFMFIEFLFHSPSVNN